MDSTIINVSTSWSEIHSVNYKKGCTQLAAASDKVSQLLAQGRWFSPGTPGFLHH